MGWSPQDAMKAYLSTLDLRKIESQQGKLQSRTPLTEPNCMEFISALAAGNQTKLMVEITTQGITPLTLALALAAKQTGGHLICILPPHDNIEKITSPQILSHGGYTDLRKTIKLVIGNPCEIIKEYKNIEFAVIDGRFEDCSRLFKCIDVDAKKSVVIVNNKICGTSYAETVKGRIGIKSAVSLPIGEGMELTKIGYSGGKRRYKRSRFYVVVEN